MSIRANRLVAAGALAVAAVAAPIAIALTSGNAAESSATGPCLAWYGNKDDGVCLSYSNGGGASGGVPQIGYGTPGSGNPGFSTGPLLPGNTINKPLN